MASVLESATSETLIRTGSMNRRTASRKPSGLGLERAMKTRSNSEPLINEDNTVTSIDEKALLDSNEDHRSPLKKSESSFVVFRMVKGPTMEKMHSRSMDMLNSGTVQEPNAAE